MLSKCFLGQNNENGAPDEKIRRDSVQMVGITKKVTQTDTNDRDREKKTSLIDTHDKVIWAEKEIFSFKSSNLAFFFSKWENRYNCTHCGKHTSWRQSKRKEPPHILELLHYVDCQMKVHVAKYLSFSFLFETTFAFFLCPPALIRISALISKENHEIFGELLLNSSEVKNAWNKWLWVVFHFS